MIRSAGRAVRRKNLGAMPGLCRTRFRGLPARGNRTAGDPVAMPAAPASAGETDRPGSCAPCGIASAFFPKGGGAVVATGQAVHKNPGRLLCTRMAEIGNRGVGAADNHLHGSKPQAPSARVSANFGPCFLGQRKPFCPRGKRKSVCFSGCSQRQSRRRRTGRTLSGGSFRSSRPPSPASNCTAMATPCAHRTGPPGGVHGCSRSRAAGKTH